MSTQTNLKSNQSGIAHLGLILLFVAVIGIIGAVGYRVVQDDKSDEPATVLSSSEPTVTEDQDADGEILPDADTSTDEGADIDGDDAAQTEAN